MAKVTPKGREEMVYFAALLTNFLTMDWPTTLAASQKLVVANN